VGAVTDKYTGASIVNATIFCIHDFELYQDKSDSAGVYGISDITVDPLVPFAFTVMAGGYPNVNADIDIPLPATYVHDFEMMNTDGDGDGIPDVYETNTGAYSGLTATGSDPANPDTDGDGANDGDEVLAGMSALDREELFRLLGVNYSLGAGSEVVLTWSSVTGKQYTVSWASNLVDGFEVLESNIVGVLPDNTYTDVFLGTGPGFYRIEVE